MVAYFFEHVGIFLIWWSVWSLLDTYLLVYSPYSEVAVFFLGVLALSVLPLRRRLSLSVVSDTMLQKIPI